MPSDSKKSYQYIFFDWDGCLAKSLDMWFETIKATLEEYKINPTDRQVCSLIGDLYNGSVRLGVPAADYVTFKSKIYARTDSYMDGISLYEGAESLLRELKTKGKTIALITSASRGYIDELLKLNGIAKYFDLIITGSDVENRKPHPEGIEKALKKLGSEKRNAVMIGDSQHDLGAAKSAGVDSVLFYPDSHAFFYDIEHLRSLSPTYVVRTFSELGSILIPEN